MLDRAILDTIHKIVSDFIEDEDSSVTEKCAVVMVAALFLGPDVGAISRVTGYRDQFVEAVAHNLQLSGMWLNGEINYEDPLDNVSYYVQTLVAEGNVVRSVHKCARGYEYMAPQNADADHKPITLVRR